MTPPVCCTSRGLTKPDRARGPLPAVAAAMTMVLAGCTGSAETTTDAAEVTVTNCDERVTYPQPAELFVNSPNKVAMVLAIGAAEQLVGVAGIAGDEDVLRKVYGADVVDDLPIASADYPTFENVIAQQPEVYVAGWSSGYDEQTNLTPDGLADHDIAAYTASYTCRQQSGDARGIMPPWQALTTDLANLGDITGHQRQAQDVVADVEARLDALRSAPQPEDEPTVFLFDSGTDDVFTSGSFGGPQAIIEAAGGRNALEDVDDTWTSVSWERVASSEPDFIAFVDYGEQTFEDKVEVLRNNPATKDLPAVKEERFHNIPISAWTSGPLNIDAAEQLRNSLEQWDLVPDSDIEPEHDLTP